MEASFKYIRLIAFLVVVFSGFYLKMDALCLVYWVALIAFFLFAYLKYKGWVQTEINSAIILASLFCGYVLVSHFFHGLNSSFLNVVFSVLYFILTYEILINVATNDIIGYCKKLFWVSILLLVAEAIWRFSHPVLEQPSFYKFKFNSIMYMDSNFVAVFVMSLYFFALYLQENHNLNLKKERITLVVLLGLTLSRATIMVTAICAILFTKRISWKWKRIIILIGGTVTVLLLLVMLGDESNEMRLYIIKQAISFYLERATISQKAFGIGFGRTADYVGFGSHLFFITYLLESGAVGLALLTIFWAVLLKKSNFRIGYVMIPFLITGFSMTPHFVPYIYCAYAIIIVLENRVGGTNEKNTVSITKRGRRPRDE